MSSYRRQETNRIQAPSNGGGGRGGHAIGIALSGATHVDTASVIFKKGTPGAGGKGDGANDNPGDGAVGIVDDVHAFP